MNITIDHTLGNDATISFDEEDASAWVTVELGEGRPNASLYIRRADEGLIVDIFPVSREDEQPVASTYVFDNELSNEWADAKEAGRCDRCHDVIRDAGGVLIDSTGGDICEDDLPHVLELEVARPIFIDEIQLIDPAILGTDPIFIDEMKTDEDLT